MTNIQATTIVVSVKVLEPRLKNLGPAVIKCYVSNPQMERIEEKALVVEGDIFESIAAEIKKIKRELRKNVSPRSLIIIEVTGKGFVYRVGGKIEETGEEALLFPSPSKLIRMGFFGNGRLIWHRPAQGEELYIYEGIIDVPEDVEYVIIETENGSRVINTVKRHLERDTG